MRIFIAFITALYALGFAFSAIMAIRWPSLLALGAVFGTEGNVFAQAQTLMDWRGLGIHIGVAYFIAALCFHTSASLIWRTRPGAASWMLVGSLVGFPPFLLFDFEPGWWRAPDVYEQAVMIAALATFFLLSMVWELRPKSKRGSKTDKTRARADETIGDDTLDNAPMHLPANPPEPKAEAKAKSKRRRYGPVPAAIARQRASFAAHGRGVQTHRKKPRIVLPEEDNS